MKPVGAFGEDVGRDELTDAERAARDRPQTQRILGTGSVCGNCGGLMRRTGACETCPMCGTSNGGCG